MSLKIIFAGTPDFACPVLRGLLNSAHSIVAVYTQPDRPKGRGQQLEMSPVKQLALEAGLPILQPNTLKNKEAVEQLKQYAPDLMIVVAYGLLLPKTILAIPKFGCINVHASLLPRWRGASPIQQAILAGDKTTGVTIMQMVEALDAGDILAAGVTDITSEDTSQTLHDRLALLGAELLLPAINDVEHGCPVLVPQEENQVTYAKKINKNDAKIDWNESAAYIARQVRAYFGWPVAFTHFENKLMRIWQAEVIEADFNLTPGRLIVVDRKLLVACKLGMLQLQKIQLAGGRVLSAQDFINAQQLKLLQQDIVLC